MSMWYIARETQHCIPPIGYENMRNSKHVKYMMVEQHVPGHPAAAVLISPSSFVLFPYFSISQSRQRLVSQSHISERPGGQMMYRILHARAEAKIRTRGTFTEKRSIPEVFI